MAASSNTATDFGTPTRYKFSTPDRKFGKNSAPPTPGSGTSEGVDRKLRAQAQPFFMTGIELKAVVPLAGYFPGPNPNFPYSPYHYTPERPQPTRGDAGPGADLPRIPDFPILTDTETAPAQALPPAAPVSGNEKEKGEDKEATVSEEDWMRRIAKRDQEVTKMKGMRFYQNFIQKVPKREDRAEDDPVTPRAEDRGLSKRRWKANFDDWVNVLRKKYDGKIHTRAELLKPLGEKGARPEALLFTLKTKTVADINSKK